FSLTLRSGEGLTRSQGRQRNCLRLAVCGVGAARASGATGLTRRAAVQPVRQPPRYSCVRTRTAAVVKLPRGRPSASRLLHSSKTVCRLFANQQGRRSAVCLTKKPAVVPC